MIDNRTYELTLSKCKTADCNSVDSKGQTLLKSCKATLVFPKPHPNITVVMF